MTMNDPIPSPRGGDARPSGVRPADAPASEDLLGDTPATWREGMRNGYLRWFLVHALMQTGASDELRRRGARGATAEELASACGVDGYLLHHVLTYLSHADRVLRKEQDRFHLTERGEWLFAPGMKDALIVSIDAYGCILAELVPALKGEKRYGRDFKRRGDAVAAASLIATRPNYPFIIDTLRRYDITCVADLGCGAAGLLVDFCRLAPELRGVGVDVDPGSLAEAARTLAHTGLSDRVALIRADIGAPEELAARPELEPVQAFNCCGVLHEFFRDGDDAVVDILRRFKRLFPGRYFFLGEFRARTDDEYQRAPLLERTRPLWFQHLMHPLSLQGLPRTRDEWGQIFDRAGVQQVDVRDYFLDQYVLKL